jgi:hypothetical protein
MVPIVAAVPLAQVAAALKFKMSFFGQQPRRAWSAARLHLK